MSQTTFLIVAGVSLALLAASGNIDGFRARPRMPQRVLSQAELQLFTTTRGTGEIVMAGSSGVVIDQGNQAIRVGTSAITFMAGTTADTEVVRIGENGNVGIGTTNSSDRLAVQGTMRLNGTSAALSLNDGNSGLTYSSTVNAFVGSGTTAKPSNGPVLFGQLDGALGTKSGGQANALYWNTTGVGIKNNAPAYALDVTGGVHATSNAIFDSKVGIGTNAPGASYALDVTGGVHATSNAIFDAKVGIGTNAPGASYALDVVGRVHATSNAIFDAKVGIGTATPGTNYALDVVGGVHATTASIFDANVGIGNASPAYKLDVTGDVNFTGSLYQGGSLFKTSQWNTTGSDIVYTAGKIGIGVTQPTSALHVSSGSEVNLANAIVVKNVSTTSLAASVNTGVTAATLESRWGLSYNSSNSVLTLSRESNATVGRSGLYTTFPTPFPVGTIFTVTINYGPYNNSSPVPRPYFTANDSAGYLVGVAAFPSITTSTAAANYTLTYTLTAPTPRFGLDWEGAQGAYARLYSFSASVQTPVTSTAVNVGVGTTNPYKPFHITGSSTGDISALISNTNTALSSSASLGFGLWPASGSGSGTSGFAGQISAICMNAFSGNTDMAFSTYTGSYVGPNYTLVERMRITASGNVGIGTTNTQGNFLMLHNPGSVSGISLGDYNMTARKYIGITVLNGGTDIVDGHGFSGITFGVPSSTDGGCLIFCTHNMGVDSGERMRIAKNGYVGIGTLTPQAPLHIEANRGNMNTSSLGGIPNSGNGFYYVYASGITGWAGGWGLNCSIYSRYAIVCGDYIIAASDERIKKNIQPISGALDKIKRLDVVSYDRIDFREKGVDAGVIARNVQSVLPKAVALTKFTIPNIYLKATHLKIRSGVLIEVKCDDKDIKEGSKVKLMIVQGDKEIEHVSPMKNWTGTSFEVEEWKEYSEEDKVFAYGVEVDDFLNVDKEQIGILTAGAVKELLAIVEDQKGRIEALERAVQTLR